MLCVGHPIVTLWLTSSSPPDAKPPLRDVDVFCFVEVVRADGTCHYVTEGAFRASHRAAAPCSSALSPWTDPCRDDKQLQSAYDAARHPFTEACRVTSALPALGDPPVELTFTLLPICFRFARGSRVRLALSTYDRHYFGLSHGVEGGGIALLASGSANGGHQSGLVLPVYADESHV